MNLTQQQPISPTAALDANIEQNNNNQTIPSMASNEATIKTNKKIKEINDKIKNSKSSSAAKTKTINKTDQEDTLAVLESALEYIPESQTKSKRSHGDSPNSEQIENKKNRQDDELSNGEKSSDNDDLITADDLSTENDSSSTSEKDNDSKIERNENR